MLLVSEDWKSAYPGASVGVLAMSPVANPDGNARLDARKEALEVELRSSFASLSRTQLKLHPLLAPYTTYYKRFGKTYHLQNQLESVVFKAKAIPRAAALVEAMFMAELKSMLLTAGHDLDTVHGDLVLDVAIGIETYLTLGGQQQTLKQGDMFIRDELGVLSSILYGPDHRTRITPTTTRVLFTVYAPVGVAEERIRDHLDDLGDFVLTVSPEAQIEHTEIVGAKTSS